MILYEVFPNKTLKILEDEKTYITENLISSVHIKLPSTFGDYPVKELTAELRFYFPEGDYMAYAVDTQQARPEVPITNDITEKPQTLSVMLFFYKGGNVIGKTNSVDKVILDAPLKGEPLTPRAEFDEVIAEQRETIAEQAETITEQVETIGSQGEQITELSGEVTELTSENTRLEALTETQRETIQNMLDNPPQPQLYTPPEPIKPNDQTKIITAPQGYDGLSSVTVDKIPKQATLEKLLNGDDFLDITVNNPNAPSYFLYGFQNINSVKFKNTEIEKDNWLGLSSCRKISFGKIATRIGGHYNGQLSSIKKLIIPERITSLSSYAFDIPLTYLKILSNSLSLTQRYSVKTEAGGIVDCRYITNPPSIGGYGIATSKCIVIVSDENSKSIFASATNWAGIYADGRLLTEEEYIALYGEIPEWDGDGGEWDASA